MVHSHLGSIHKDLQGSQYLKPNFLCKYKAFLDASVLLYQIIGAFSLGQKTSIGPMSKLG